MTYYGRTRRPGPVDPSAAASGYLPTVMADSPWGLWAFNDGSGATVADRSGNGRDASLTNGSWNASGGPNGGAYVSLAGNGYATVPYEASLNTLTGNFTAEIWFRRSSDVAANSMLIARDGAADVWGVEARTSRVIEAYTQNPSSSYQSATTPGSTWPTSQWNHLVFRMTSGSENRVYLNGVSVATVAQTGGVKSNTSAGLIMGAFTTTTRRFTGDLAWGAFYLSALSEARIAAHYAAMTS